MASEAATENLIVTTITEESYLESKPQQDSNETKTIQQLSNAASCPHNNSGGHLNKKKSIEKAGSDRKRSMCIAQNQTDGINENLLSQNFHEKDHSGVSSECRTLRNLCQEVKPENSDCSEKMPKTVSQENKSIYTESQHLDNHAKKNPTDLHLKLADEAVEASSRETIEECNYNESHRIDLTETTGGNSSCQIAKTLKLSKDDPSSLYGDKTYAAPEQALVTSVELVVPPPRQSNIVYDESSVTTRLQFDTGAFNSTSNSIGKNKTDGCETDSSLSLKNSTNLTLSAATGDILLTERRDTVWAPQNDYKESRHMPATTSNSIEMESTESSAFEKPQQHSYPPSEHLLASDIYRAQPSETEAFTQIDPIPSQQHDHAQQQYNHEQIVQQHHQHHVLQANMYPQIIHQQEANSNTTNHMQPHYQDYSQQNYSHLFVVHHLDPSQQSHHVQQQLHHQLEAHTQQQQPLQPHYHQHHLQQLQHRQLHENYHEILMDDFHDDSGLAYKLNLSPNNVKPENQDDGYETGAGDVLTPNSHSSSTHSGTPQHQIQHANIGNAINKHEDMQSQNFQLAQNQHPQNIAEGHASQSPLQFDRMTLHKGDDHNAANDSQNFMGEMQMLSPAGRNSGATPNASRYMSIAESEQTKNIYSLKHQTVSLDVRHGIQQQEMGQQHLLQSERHIEDSKPSISQEIDGANSQHLTNECKGSDSSGKTCQKKRGRKKKNVGLDGLPIPQQCVSDKGCEALSLTAGGVVKTKERKKHDRFNGMSEAEVFKRIIPDHLCENLDIVIVGINPGLFAAYKGHHYAGPGNHFWKCLYLSGLTQEQMSADDDHKLIKHGIGFTNMVARATKGSADLTRKEIKDGSRILLEKLQRFKPKIAVFNGKLIFEVFSGKKEFNFGRQPDCVEGTDTYIWVMPSSSARCAQLPRAADKVPFYAALKKFRDYLNGLIPHIDDSECIFTEQRIQQSCEQKSLNSSVSMDKKEQCGLLLCENARISNIESKVNIDANAQQLLAFRSNEADANHQGFFFEKDGNIRNDIVQDSRSETLPAISENYLTVLDPGLQPQEKKKRGRPKKIKGQNIIDPTTGNEISIDSRQIPHNDINNILNLSIMGGGTIETPKKKRGRPKKLKTPIDLLQSKQGTQIQKQMVSHASQQTNVATLPVHQIEHTSSPHNQQAPSNLYNTPPPSHILYCSSASPMASPALNCSYSRGTPPVATQNTPPIGEQHLINDLNRNSTQCLNSPTEQMVSQNHATTYRNTSDRHTGMEETPPPSSPAICAVDFDPPTGSRIAVRTGPDQQTLTASQGLAEDSQYASLAHDQKPKAQEQYLAWSSNQTQQQRSEIKLMHQPQSTVHYPHSLAPLGYQGAAVSQEDSEQWQRHQHCYEDHSIAYMVSSPNNTLSPQSQQHIGNSQGQIVSDVARKSLSGLESLVDQIPSISEHTLGPISSSTAIAAAAVENHVGLPQHQQQKRCVSSIQSDDNQTERFGSPLTSVANNVINSNFSVSNLAASSAIDVNINNNTHFPSTSNLIGNSQNNSSSSQTGYTTHSSTTYHHPNIITAALAAAAVNSPQGAGSHHVQHPHIYMDPHMAHVNSMYGAATAPHHHPAYGHQPSTGNSEFGHYGLPSASQGTTLHMPSPNYPYGHYGHTPPQANYSSYAHHHHSHHGHSPHHLSVFERLKPSDISGYSGF